MERELAVTGGRRMERDQWQKKAKKPPDYGFFCGIGGNFPGHGVQGALNVLAKSSIVQMPEPDRGK